MTTFKKLYNGHSKDSCESPKNFKITTELYDKICNLIQEALPEINQSEDPKAVLLNLMIGILSTWLINSYSETDQVLILEFLFGMLIGDLEVDTDPLKAH